LVNFYLDFKINKKKDVFHTPTLIIVSIIRTSINPSFTPALRRLQGGISVDILLSSDLIYAKTKETAQISLFSGPKAIKVDATITRTEGEGRETPDRVHRCTARG
jgi:hypothetical protein